MLKRSLVLSMVALMASAAASLAAERNRHVRVARPDVERLSALGISALRSSDTASFRWMELSASEFGRLARSGVAFEVDEDAGHVQLNGFRFDPVAEGEPIVPADLRAGEAAGLRLVQLAGPATDLWRHALERSGVRVLQYYPHHTYLVWAEPAGAAAVRQLDFVRWQGAFHPAYKINPDLYDRDGLIENVDVTFVDDGRRGATLAAIAALGGQVVQSHPAQADRAVWDAIVRLPASAVEAVARIPAVWALGYASPRPVLDDEMSSQIVAGNYSGTPSTPFTGYNTWLSSIGETGAGVRWAVIDTGVDYQHPDLGGHIAGGSSFAGIPSGCDPGTQPGTDCNNGGHGTHVAGIIGGNAAAGFADGQGYLYGLGVARNYEIFAMNSLSSTTLWPPTGGWQEHSRRAVLGGAIGGNNSWTTGEGTNHGYQASERTHDFMVRDGNLDTTTVAEPFIEVFSAGNSGPGNNTLTAPKEAKNLIVVANSLNFRIGSIDSISSSSSRGFAVDGRVVPTVAAPGSSIASSRNDVGGPACAVAIAGTNSLYAFCSGTSMAAPQVSGAIVLMTDWWRDFNGGANPSPALAKALLVNTAVDMTANAQGVIPNREEGWGRLHLGNLFSSSARRIYRNQNAQDLITATGQGRTFRARVFDSTKPLKVTLAWTDAPGGIGANPALVNNLDLTVTTAAGTLYRGNLLSNGWSVPNGVADARNNLENVFLQTAPAGVFTIGVTATNLPGDGVPYNGDATDQDFALVCSNCSPRAPFALAIDDGAGGNRVLELGESALMGPSWRNEGAEALAAVTGSITSASPITLDDTSGAYPALAPGGASQSSDWYGLTASGPRPSQHWDAVVTETLSTGDVHGWRVHVGPTFSDVAPAIATYPFVEAVVHNGVTAGCTAGQYCPADSTTRAQMAVFVLVAKEGAGYAPPACTGTARTFADVPSTNGFCAWIEELQRRGVVGGCGGGNYCPALPVTRAEMSVLVLRTLDPVLNPAPCTVPPFADVPVTHTFCPWIREFAARGITSGCGGGNYCPAAANQRDQMAVFLTSAFGLPLYGP